MSEITPTIFVKKWHDAWVRNWTVSTLAQHLGMTVQAVNKRKHDYKTKYNLSFPELQREKVKNAVNAKELQQKLNTGK